MSFSRLLLVLLLASGSVAFADGPDCSKGWPTNMTFALLKNAGITTNDAVATMSAVRIASEKIGDDLYHQVYDVKITEKTGDVIEAIAVHNASSEECSMSDVELFVISKHLGSTSSQK